MSAAELFVWDLEEKMGIRVGATGALVNGSIELTKDFGKGVSDVINIMNLRRL